jgi:hypothetical protein
MFILPFAIMFEALFILTTIVARGRDFWFRNSWADLQTDGKNRLDA